eukprot:503829-Rhodomonas_salina.1
MGCDEDARTESADHRRQRRLFPALVRPDWPPGTSDFLPNLGLQTLFRFTGLPFVWSEWLFTDCGRLWMLRTACAWSSGECIVTARCLRGMCRSRG